MDYIGEKKFSEISDNVKQCIYNMQFGFIRPSENEEETSSIDLTRNISSFKLYKIYDDFVLPIIKVDLTISQEIHTMMCDNYDTIKFRVSISKTTDMKTDGGDYNTSLISDIVLDNVILKPNDYDRTRFRDNANFINSGFEQGENISISLELFSEELLKVNKRNIQGIMRDVTMDNVLIYSILQYGNNNKLLITPSHNKNTIPQIIFPSLNLGRTIKYLQNVYGIYKTGLRLFFDFDRTYCLSGDFIYDDVKHDDNEYPTVICYMGISLNNKTGFFVDDEKSCYYMAGINTDTFKFSDSSNKEIYGEDITIRNSSINSNNVNDVNSINNYTLENSKYNENMSSIAKSKTYYNNYDNPFTEEATKSAINRTSLRYVACFNNTDIDILTPNKKYYLKFLDDTYSEYEGLYQLEGIITDFKKFTNNMFQTSTIAYFCKLTEGLTSNS